MPSPCDCLFCHFNVAILRFNVCILQAFQRDVVTYTATINACEQSKDQWQPVLKLLAEMKAQGLQPSGYHLLCYHQYL